MITTNFHTHTCHCDGKDTPEQMVLAAIERGFTALGFSGHSYFVLDAEISMDEEKQRGYREDILRLREKYKNELEIYLGIEQDTWSPPLEYTYDYVIASAHNILKNGVFCPVDHSLDLMQKNLDLYYGGDQEAWAEDYFAEAMRLFDKVPNGDIIGHIDLITKYDEQLGITRSKHYFELAERTVRHLAAYGKPFEINTGAISRGMRTTPYPSPKILAMIREAGGRIMINSDCHDCRFLDCGFDLATRLAKSCGFDKHTVLTKNGWQEMPL